MELPVKRRRALLASTPIEDSRPELLADDEQGAQFLPSRPLTGARGRPTGGGTRPSIRRSGHRWPLRDRLSAGSSPCPNHSRVAWRAGFERPPVSADPRRDAAHIFACGPLIPVPFLIPSNLSG